MSVRTQTLILTLHAVVMAWWVGHWISMGYWTPWLAALLVGALPGVPILLTLITGMALANFASRPGRALLLPLLSYCVGATLAWGWVRLDDWSFAREVPTNESDFNRPRWFPYQSIQIQLDEAGDPIVYE